jgi:hypothetical protein
MAGELPLAPFTDAVVWLVLAVAVVRISEQRRQPLAPMLALVIAGASVLGLVVSFLIERV